MSKELKARIAELERQLAESRDFAISEAAKIRTEFEIQQAVLVEALQNAMRNAGKPEEVWWITRAALAAVKPAGQKGSE